MTLQLPLGIRLRDLATLENFIPGRNNELYAWLGEHAGGVAGRPLYLWGASGLGKTHLLHAACHHAHRAGRSAFYLPLEQGGQFAPQILDGIEHYPLLALDNIDCVMGLPQWEHALFTLYNRAQDQGSQLLITANVAPAQLGCTLPDLRSRLGWGLVYQLQDIDDADKMQALQRRAAQRGLVLGDDVVAYLLKRVPRDMPTLFALLERLDQAALAAKRKVTIPFVRELQGW